MSDKSSDGMLDMQIRRDVVMRQMKRHRGKERRTPVVAAKYLN
jgi:hypothetical protein